MPCDYSKYHPEWKERIRPDILRRANWKCEFCGVQSRAIGYREKDGTFVECDSYMQKWAIDHGFKIIKIVLTIMHLDHDITNNEYTNLKSGCQRCHNKYDMPNRIKNRKFKKAAASNV